MTERRSEAIAIRGCKRIVGGGGQGIAYVSTQPLNFLGTVDPKTGSVTDRSSELYGKSFRGAVLVFPFATGSSVGAYVFYSLRVNGMAPSAIICKRADITTASGCAIARIPLVDLPNDTDLSAIHPGISLAVDSDLGTITEKL